MSRVRLTAERLLLWLGAACVLAGTKLWLIRRFGSSVPVLDQWDGEAANLFKPYFDGTLRALHFFNPHNEHRIVLSRLLSLGLLIVNGEWDARFEMVVNAFLATTFALVLGASFMRTFGQQHRSLIITLLSLWIGLPYGQENTLWGFQSSFYFLVFFSLFALWGLLTNRPGSAGWWVGIVALVLACLSMASGFFCAVTTIAVLCGRAIRRSSSKADLATLAICLCATAMCWQFRVSVPWHEMLKVNSISQWLVMLGRCLAWPWVEQPLVSLLLYLPLVFLLLAYARTRERALNTKCELVLGCGGWVILQAAAVAYTRGNSPAPMPASRYMDILAFGSVANILALVSLSERRHLQRLSTILVVSYAALILTGAVTLSRKEIAYKRGRLSVDAMVERNVRAYVASGDPKYLRGDPPPLIAYPDGTRLQMLLDDPAIRGILPAAIRSPLPIEKVAEHGDAFIPRGYAADIPDETYEQGWGSFSLKGATAQGEMQSQELTVNAAYLRFEVAGILSPETKLTLQNNGRETKMKELRTVSPSWRTVDVVCPGRRFIVLAIDKDSNGWIAFRSPRELTTCSYLTEWLCRKGKYLSYAGGITLALSFALRLLRTDSSTPGSIKTC